MVVYDTLARILPVKKSYTFKFLSVAFVGVHVPLIGIAIYFATAPKTLDIYTIIVFMLGLTLASTSFTLIVLNKLLAPLKLTQSALTTYVNERRMPPLPIHYPDEAGQLMRDVQSTVEKLDTMLLEKSGMADLLSHDLRSPLTRIIGLSQVQKIDHKAGLTNIYADEIMEECNSALKLLGEVLTVLKHEEAADRNIALTQTPLLDIVRQCIASSDILAADKQISWIVDVDPVHELELEPTLFTQAVKNVLGNAIKFSPTGAAIHVQSKISGELLYLAVKDDGIGFDKKDREAIFNRFTGAGRAGTKGEASTGLGLYLSKKIIRRHGGDLIAESDGPGKGSTFTFVMRYNNN